MADVSVRPAIPADTSEIGRIQVETWRLAYRSLLPQAVLEDLDVDQCAASWRNAVQRPPSRRHRVLVASEGSSIVGFAAVGPDDDAHAADPSPETSLAITVLLVEPRWGRRGHGSRLLAAIADTARDDGAERLITWAPVGDPVTLDFYRSAGWEPDGLQRALDTGAGTVNELRLHASLKDAVAAE